MTFKKLTMCLYKGSGVFDGFVVTLFNLSMRDMLDIFEALAVEGFSIKSNF